MTPAPERRKEWDGAGGRGGASKNTHKTVEILETGWGHPGSERTEWPRESWIRDGRTNSDALRTGGL